MNRNLFVLLILLAASLSALLFHVADTPLSFHGPPIKIGVVVPLSGEFEPQGRMALQGALMAAEEINQGGVLGGKQIRLEIRDSQSDADTAEVACQSLMTEKKVVAILAATGSPSRKRMATLAESEGFPLLYAADYEGGECAPHVFYYSEIPDHTIRPMISYLQETQGPDVFIFGLDVPLSHKIADIATREIDARGGRVVGQEFTPYGTPDYSPVLQRIKASKSRTLLLTPSAKDGTRFIHQFNASSLKGKVTIAAIAFNESHLTQFSPGDLEGIHTCLHFMASLDSPETKAFVARHRHLFPNALYPPTHITEGSFGLLKIFSSALDRAGSLDMIKTMALMPGTRIQGGHGVITLRDDRHVNMNMVIGKFTQGELQAVKKMGEVKPTSQCPRPH
ncbi:ABC transporter substrate-binding protein [Desulfoluna sp.]|uniref:ABC transporter substrate-binding protein n=1 Tax=Desulfoluna sp. TaxID=2045199 RepID=UPI00262F63FF|nr:ABC transporter substrate-binding protein [Desulfoluna sp.]